MVFFFYAINMASKFILRLWNGLLTRLCLACVWLELTQTLVLLRDVRCLGSKWLDKQSELCYFLTTFPRDKSHIKQHLWHFDTVLFLQTTNCCCFLKSNKHVWNKACILTIWQNYYLYLFRRKMFVEIIFFLAQNTLIIERLGSNGIFSFEFSFECLHVSNVNLVIMLGNFKAVLKF